MPYTYLEKVGKVGDTVSLDFTGTFPQCNSGCQVKSVSGLPIGLAFENGVISGTIAGAAQVYEVSVVVFHEGDSQKKSCSNEGETGAFHWRVVEESPSVAVSFSVPSSFGPQGTYLRMGTKEEGDPSDDHEKEVHTHDGWYSYTEGARVEVTKGEVTRVNHNGATDYYYGDQFDFAADNVYEFTHGVSFESKAGMDSALFIGGQFAATVAASVEIAAGAMVEYSLAGRYSATVDKEREFASEFEQEATRKIFLSVDPADDKLESVTEVWAPWIAGVTAAALSLTGAVASGDNPPEEEQTAGKVAAYGSFAAYGAGLLTAMVDSLRPDKSQDSPVCEFLMEGDRSTDPKLALRVRPVSGDGDDGPMTFAITEKAIQLKAGKATVTLAEEDGLITIDVGKVKMHLNDKEGQVRLEHENGGHVTLADGALTLEHPSEIHIKAPEVVVDASKSFNAKSPKGTVGEVDIGPKSPPPAARKWPKVVTPVELAKPAKTGRYRTP